MGDLRSIPGLQRSPGEGKGYPLQYSGLENSMDCPWDRKKSDMTERLSLHFTSLPVFLPGKSHGQRSLVGYSPWGHKESDMTDCLSTAQEAFPSKTKCFFNNILRQPSFNKTYLNIPIFIKLHLSSTNFHTFRF